MATLELQGLTKRFGEFTAVDSMNLKAAEGEMIALLGGSAGAWAGMYLFHHKTKHWYFVVGMPLILILQICITALIGNMHGFGM